MPSALDLGGLRLDVAPAVLAFKDVAAALRTLASARGHVLGRAQVESQFELAIPCTRCDRWVTISLAPTAKDPSITGRVLGSCRGTPWGPPAAVPMSSGLDPTLAALET